MKAVPGELPSGDDWAFEIKWDGMRCLLEAEGDRTVLRSAKRADITARFPELAGIAGAAGGRHALIDGEIVCFDPTGRPSFAALQPHIPAREPLATARLAATSPAAFIAFDLLWLDGVDATPLDYRQRRQLLRDLLSPLPGIQVPDHRIGGGADLFAASRAQGLEGIVAKRLGSRYEPGRRSASWRKIKVRRDQEFVVGGFTTGSGARAATFGALLLGRHDRANRFRFCGAVGSGFDDALLDTLAAGLRCAETAECPFIPEPQLGAASGRPRWVAPELVVRVSFAEWTPEGRIRHPTFEVERPDLTAADLDPADVEQEWSTGLT